MDDQLAESKPTPERSKQQLPKPQASTVVAKEKQSETIDRDQPGMPNPAF